MTCSLIQPRYQNLYFRIVTPKKKRDGKRIKRYVLHMLNLVILLQTQYFADQYLVGVIRKSHDLMIPQNCCPVITIIGTDGGSCYIPNHGAPELELMWAGGKPCSSCRGTLWSGPDLCSKFIHYPHLGPEEVD